MTTVTVVGGSTQIGNHCWIGFNSAIKDKLKVGDNMIIGSGSSVIHNVEDQDIVAGSTATSIKNKITLDEDKLFLMSGQKINNTNKMLKGHKFLKKDFLSDKNG